MHSSWTAICILLGNFAVLLGKKFHRSEFWSDLIFQDMESCISGQKSFHLRFFVVKLSFLILKLPSKTAKLPCKSPCRTAWLNYISVNLPIHDYLRKVFEAEEQMMILNEELANLKRKLELSDSQVRWLHMCNKWHYHWKKATHSRL